MCLEFPQSMAIKSHIYGSRGWKTTRKGNTTSRMASDLLNPDCSLPQNPFLSFSQKCLSTLVALNYNRNSLRDRLLRGHFNNANTTLSREKQR